MARKTHLRKPNRGEGIVSIKPRPKIYVLDFLGVLFCFISVEWLTFLCNLIVAQGRIPDDWKSSMLLPVFKGKGDPMECGSYRAIKLLEHAMKVIERVFERRIREKVKIDAMQFGFMPGKGTADAIFTVR